MTIETAHDHSTHGIGDPYPFPECAPTEAHHNPCHPTTSTTVPATPPTTTTSNWQPEPVAPPAEAEQPVTYTSVAQPAPTVPELANTGAYTDMLGGLAIVLCLAGAAMVRLSRKMVA